MIIWYILSILTINCSNCLKLKPIKDFFFRGGVFYQWHCLKLLMQFYNKSNNKSKLILVRFLTAFIFSTDNVSPFHLYPGLEGPLVLLPMMCHWIFPKLLSLLTTWCLKFSNSFGERPLECKYPKYHLDPVIIFTLTRVYQNLSESSFVHLFNMLNHPTIWANEYSQAVS